MKVKINMGYFCFDKSGECYREFLFLVIIQGKKGQMFSDFILAVSSPYQGEFSEGDHHESFGCDLNQPDKKAWICYYYYFKI